MRLYRGIILNKLPAELYNEEKHSREISGQPDRLSIFCDLGQ